MTHPADDPLRAALAAQIAEGLGAILRKFCDSPEAHLARRNLHAMPDSDWRTLIQMLSEECAWTARTALQPSAKDALQVIADLPTGRTEEVMEGQEAAYRAVEALFTTPPQITCSAAPQPAPEPLGGCGLPCGFDCNGACFDPAPASADERAAMVDVIERALYETYARWDIGDPAEYIADALLAAGWTRGGAEAGLREALMEAAAGLGAILATHERGEPVTASIVQRWYDEARSALARPSAPETPACSICAKSCDTTENGGPEVQLHNDLWCCSSECYEKHPEGGLKDERDAAAPETLAWAVVGHGGGLLPGNTFASPEAAERFSWPHGRVVRVAIRVVEDGGG